MDINIAKFHTVCVYFVCEFFFDFLELKAWRIISVYEISRSLSFLGLIFPDVFTALISIALCTSRPGAEMGKHVCASMCACTGVCILSFSISTRANTINRSLFEQQHPSAGRGSFLCLCRLLPLILALYEMTLSIITRVIVLHCYRFAI